MVTVVLTIYKRDYTYPLQLHVLKKEKIVSEILVCDNRKENKGVWERFNIAKKAKNDYVLILDDDIIPGSRWIDLTFKKIVRNPALYSTSGSIIKKMSEPKMCHFGYGDESNDNTWTNIGTALNHVYEDTPADWGIQSWFIKKEWLEYFWRYNPTEDEMICGEDMNLSYQLQKEGIPILVTGIDSNDFSTWGSVSEKYGRHNALWWDNPNDFRNKMYNFFDKQYKKGWVLLNN